DSTESNMRSISRRRSFHGSNSVGVVKRLLIIGSMDIPPLLNFWGRSAVRGCSGPSVARRLPEHFPPAGSPRGKHPACPQSLPIRQGDAARRVDSTEGLGRSDRVGSGIGL